MRHEWGHKATNVEGSASISTPAAAACMQMFFAECLIEARDFLSQSNCEKCHFQNKERSVSLETRKYYSRLGFVRKLGKVPGFIGIFLQECLFISVISVKQKKYFEVKMKEKNYISKFK